MLSTNMRNDFMTMEEAIETEMLVGIISQAGRNSPVLLSTDRLCYFVFCVAVIAVQRCPLLKENSKRGLGAIL